MPMTRDGNVQTAELPSTLQRSPRKAQETFAKARDAAVEEYGVGRRASQTAYAALKHKFEKVGDHWEPKPGGGSRRRSSPASGPVRGGRISGVTRGGGSARAKATARGKRPHNATDGVDTNASKRHLYELARRLAIPGRSSMSRRQLVNAIRKENRNATSRAGVA
jgi:ChaB